MEPVVQTAKDAAIARMLTSHVQHLDRLGLRIIENHQTKGTLVLTAAALLLLLDILTEMAVANAITLIPVNAELTTQQAAVALNLSRPFFTRQTSLPTCGHHRRSLSEDLMRYNKKH